MKIFYIDLVFKKNVDTSHELVVVAETDLEAKEEVIQVVKDPDSIDSMSVIRSFNIDSPPIVISISNFEKGAFKFTNAKSKEKDNA